MHIGMYIDSCIYTYIYMCGAHDNRNSNKMIVIGPRHELYPHPSLCPHQNPHAAPYPGPFPQALMVRAAQHGNVGRVSYIKACIYIYISTILSIFKQ